MRTEVRLIPKEPKRHVGQLARLAALLLVLAWMLTDPQRTHRLMQVVTDSYIRGNRYVEALLHLPAGHAAWMGADIAEMLSPALFCEFVVPYYRQVSKVYSRPRNFHMCGRYNKGQPRMA